MVYNVYGDNTTALSEAAVTIDESFVPSYGFAEAMVESAQMDFNVFSAMLKADAVAIKINEAAGYELTVSDGKKKMDMDSKSKEKLRDVAKANVANIIKKIEEGFNWLIEKIISAAAAVKRKMVELIRRDAAFIKKYEGVLKKVSSIDDSLKIKCESVKGVTGFKGVSLKLDKYDPNKTNFKLVPLEWYFVTSGDSSEVSVSSLAHNGSGLIQEFKIHAKMMSEYDKRIQSNMKQLRMDAKSFGRKIKTDDEAGKAYKAFTEYKKMAIKSVNNCQKAYLIYYKLLRSAITKVAGTVAKTESCILDWILEESDYQVDDIMDTAVEKDPEDITDVSQADVDLTDSSVSNDPDKLTYDDDCYSQEESTFFFDEPLF